MMQIRLHLVTGEVVDGATSNDIIPGPIEGFKESIKDLFGSEDPGVLSLNWPDGRWALFPKSSVLYVEVISSEVNPDGG